MLGHTSIVLTAGIYADVLSQVAREAAERTALSVLRDAGRGRRRVQGPGRRGLVLVPLGHHPAPSQRGLGQAIFREDSNLGFCCAPGPTEYEPPTGNRGATH